MWETLKEIRKFTCKADVDQILGPPAFQVEDRPVYYYGKGFLIHYSPMCFRVEGLQRQEYGEAGEYAIGCYHFPDTSILKEDLGLTYFYADDVTPLKEDIVDGIITYQSTFQEIHQKAALYPLEYYREGETQMLAEGQMTFKKRWITWEQYEFFFYGKSRKTQVSGFRFAFTE